MARRRASQFELSFLVEPETTHSAGLAAGSCQNETVVMIPSLQSEQIEQKQKRRTKCVKDRRVDTYRNSSCSRLIESGVDRANHPAIYVRALFQLGLLKMELGDE